MTRTLCSCCGGGVEDEEFADYQRANITDGQTPMCRECINTTLRNSPQLEAAFDAIYEALSAENRREWESFSFEEKFVRFLHYHDQGIITPADTGVPRSDRVPLKDFGSVSLGELVRLKCAEFRYDEATPGGA